MLELRLKKEELLRGVSKTQSIAEKRSSMPILSNVLLEAEGDHLTITATDLETSFKGTYEAEVLGQGRLTVPARKFYDIVRVMPDEEFSLKETDNYGLTMVGARSSYHLHGLSPEDFPPMPQFEGVRFVDLSGELLLDFIDKAIHSVAAEETRYNLAGVFVEQVEQEGKSRLRWVSTDGHRLSLVEKEVPGGAELELDKGVIISRKGLLEMRKLAEEGGELSLGFTQNSGVLTRAEAVLVMRLLEGRFPDYNLVIPQKNDKVVTVSRKDFLEMIRRISVMSTDRHKGVKFAFSPKEVTLSVVNPDLGEAEESMPAEYEGDSFEIGFNARYFIEALSALKSDLVKVAFKDPTNPCLLTADEDPGYKGVIMPMKL